MYIVRLICYFSLIAKARVPISFSQIYTPFSKRLSPSKVPLCMFCNAEKYFVSTLRRRSWYSWAPTAVCTTAAVPEWGCRTLTFDPLTVSEIWEFSSTVGWRWRGTSTTFRVCAYSSSDNCESSVDPSPRTLLMIWYAHSYAYRLLQPSPRFLSALSDW